MKKNILIIGKKSFIAKNINSFLGEKINIKLTSFEKFKILTKKKLNQFDYLINCAINKNYINDTYSIKNDIDFLISKKIINSKIKIIFFSSRKVYKIGNNLKETGKLEPRCNYSKNKLITEKILQKKFKKRLLIFRISNLIGPIRKIKSRRKIHKTFIETYFKNINKNIIFDNKKIYKDFLSINKFCEILEKSIKLNLNGTYNISIGKKIYLNDIVEWLNYYNPNSLIKKTLPHSFNNDSFYLNNNKIKKKLKITFNKQELKNYCLNLSKEFFKKK